MIKVGENAYGIQGHLELTREMFEVWLGQDSWLLEMDQEELRRDYEELRLEYESNGRKIIENFLRIATLI